MVFSGSNFVGAALAAAKSTQAKQTLGSNHMRSKLYDGFSLAPALDAVFMATEFAIERITKRLLLYAAKFDPITSLCSKIMKDIIINFFRGLRSGYLQWLLAYCYSQLPGTLGLSNISLGLYLDG